MNTIIKLFSVAIEKLGGDFIAKVILFLGLSALIPFLYNLITKITKNKTVALAAAAAGSLIWTAFFAAAGAPFLACLFALFAAMNIWAVIYNVARGGLFATV